MITAIAFLVDANKKIVGYRLLDDSTGRVKDVSYGALSKSNIDISNLLIRDGNIGIKYPTQLTIDLSVVGIGNTEIISKYAIIKDQFNVRDYEAYSCTGEEVTIPKNRLLELYQDRRIANAHVIVEDGDPDDDSDNVRLAVVTHKGIAENEITNPVNLKNAYDIWPNNLYCGKVLFYLAYRNYMEPVRNYETQEVYLGYIFNKDTFVMGYDMWGESFGSIVRTFKINRNDFSLTETGLKVFKGNGGFYKGLYNSGKLKKQFGNLTDLRLD